MSPHPSVWGWGILSCYKLDPSSMLAQCFFFSTEADPEPGLCTTPYQNVTKDLLSVLTTSCAGASASPTAVGQWARKDASDGVGIDEPYK